ncbi:MAG: sigma-54 interaction domain-containing protein [Candidatus Cryptobacteroides sp.]
MEAQELQKIKNKYDIIGNDPALNRAIEMAMAVALTELTVLVTGESGVGKDNIPRIIHQNGRRKNAKYFAVNCGAIPEGTIDSELFGHVKGSFTGAVDDRKGYFEVADGGTLFLDEVGELPLPSQAKLLRVLQSGEYIRVGDSKVSKTDVRVIAATNVDLLYAVSKGKFREDLYYRLNAVQIRMPALRDRKQDIYLLFRKFTSDFSEKYGMNKVTLTHDAVDMLSNYRWPGNIRQLKNVTETVTALESHRLSPVSGKCEVNAETLSRYIPHDDVNTLPVAYEDNSENISRSEKQEIYKALYGLNAEINKLKQIIASGNLNAASQVASPLGDQKSLPVPDEGYVSRPDSNWNKEDIDIQGDIETGRPLREIRADDDEAFSISKVSQELIRKALEKHNGNRKKAAEELGISERTLYRKLPPEYKSQKK